MNLTPSRFLFIVLGFVISSFVLSGCSDDGKEGKPAYPIIVIDSPADHTEFSAPDGFADIEVEVSVDDLPDGDRVELLLDDEVVANLPAEGRYTFEKVAKGVHLIDARAVRSTGELYEGDPADDRIQITVIGECKNNAECNDDNDCTFDICTADGICAYELFDLCEDVLSGPVCKTDTDCTPLLEGKDACVAVRCIVDTAKCELYDLEDGVSCGEDDLCVSGRTCTEAVCGAGDVVVCDDENVCTDDGCESSVGCVFTTNQAPCDDANACTTDDLCVDGACSSGEALVCEDDENVCTDEFCDEDAGCVSANNTEPCDDGEPCSVDDSCEDGVCAAGAPLLCEDDANPCTDEGCEEGVGCVSTDNTATCDDGDVCSEDDLCADGNCEAGSPLNCDDGNACTADSCDSAEGCLYADISGTCDDGNICTDDACDPETGCTVAANTDFCDDGNACTTGDVCADGGCAGGAPPTCEDDNVCTEDGCDETSGCTFTPIFGACDDGDACTTNDLCQAGDCVPTGNLDCDDDNVCTDDGCDGATGCTTAAAEGACSDGDVCTPDDVCVDGACVGGGALDCNDNNACSNDFCTPTAGCQHTSTSGNGCDDGNACTSPDICAEGICTTGLLDCNDGNSCTDDSCDASSGCVNAPNTAACDDGDSCTADDACSDGGCASGSAVDCEDGNECTVTYCDSGLGCQTVSLDGSACDDADACSSGDVCSDGQCFGDLPVLCDDGNICTNDDCDADTGCFNISNTSVCDDGNQCTVGDFCQGGGCVSGGDFCDCSVDSDCPADDNLCDGQLFCDVVGDLGSPNTCQNDPTTEVVCGGGGDSACGTSVCVPETGECLIDAVPNGQFCDDGELCTEFDHCLDGACTGAEVSCDDGNQCTQDECDATTGCQSTELVGPCDDGNACTTADTCVAGSCETTLLNCGDGDPCTDDACDPVSGCFYNTNSAPCDDGDACSAGDLCVDGSCLSGNSASCDDGNACTVDSCHPVDGCQTSALTGASCDDGNACTAKDYCAADGACVGEGAIVCDDGNTCTNDLCDPAVGCVQTANTSVCDDGQSCTLGDFCQDGTCQAGTNICDCETTSDCPADDNVCDGILFCDLGGVVGKANTCQNDVSQALVCDGETGSCAKSKCDPDAGQCLDIPAIDGLLCEDGDACTTFDHCEGGSCAGVTILCLDGDSCTDDDCDSTAGCVFPFNSVPCDDGNLCTDGDSCADGKCVGIGSKCDDGNLCTADFCDPATGCATVFLDGAACDDGNACSKGDTCLTGACEAGPPIVCDDGDACTADSCEPATGCVAEDVSGDCDDGNGCTDNSCDSLAGCVIVPNVNPCDDNDACTSVDVCGGGACVSGAPVDCNDGDVCTDDGCNASDGCEYAFNTDFCDDGDLCTGGESCFEGSCVDGVMEAACYPEDVICVVDGAVGDTAICLLLLARETFDTNLPAALQLNLNYDFNEVQIDGFKDLTCFGPGGTDPCVMMDVPPGTLWPTGHGVSMAPSDITDWSGLGTLVIANISNPLATLTEAYLDESGGLVGEALFLEMHVSLLTGALPASPIFLTVEGVVAATASSNAMVTSVVGGMIVVGDSPADCIEDPSQCDDGIPCTNDACDGFTGDCVFTPDDAVCTDGVDCTLDICNVVVGCESAPDDSACSDGAPCTVDYCDGVGGCLSDPAPEGAPCEDGDACSTGETCSSQVCAGGTPIPCDDGNSCTTDDCDSATGCTETPLNGVSCEDGDACTEGDSCSNGSCVGGTPLATPACTDGLQALCSLSGEAGEKTSCFLQLAADVEGVKLATGIQFTLSYEGDLLALDNFYDEACFPGIGCFPTSATGSGSFPLSTGHSISLGPPAAADWDGFGGVIVTNLVNPSAVLTSAYLAPDGSIVGDADFVEIRFDVLASIPATDPTILQAGALLATDENAATLDMSVGGEGLFVTTEP